MDFFFTCQQKHGGECGENALKTGKDRNKLHNLVILKVLSRLNGMAQENIFKKHERIQCTYIFYLLSVRK